MSDSPGERYGIPDRAIDIEVPIDVATRSVTVVDLVNAVQAMQRFVVASSALSLAAARGSQVDHHIDELYRTYAGVRTVLMSLLEKNDGQP